jgi:hypothetical protein
MGQCFQDIGLTKWTSIIMKQYPNEADYTKANFDECIRDYLEAVASFPNAGNQLIFWIRMDKKMPVSILVTQEGISIFKFPERFLEISCKDLISFTLLTTLII